MDVLIVRHGESAGNAEGRMQGRRDLPLTDLGRAQSQRLAQWLKHHEVIWDAAYCSPLTRAMETARILSAETQLPAAAPDPDLSEIHAGELEGLDREAMAAIHPEFLLREIMNLGDFAEFGGESYEEVQERIRRVLDGLVRRHRDPPQRVLIVGHGGVNFQLVKAATCIPVPRICVMRWGNCTAGLLRFRHRRGVYMAEVAWHVPIELMGGSPGGDSSSLFR